MPEPASRSQSTRQTWIRRGIVAAFGAGFLGAILSARRGPEVPAGLSPDEYRAAERQFIKTYQRKPARNDVLSLAGELAIAGERLESAVGCFGAIPTADSRYGLSARLQEGQVLLRLNRAHQAEQSLREFLSRAALRSSVSAEHVITACKWLGYLYSVELRQEERRELLEAVHRRNQADVFDSLQFYFPNLLLWHTPGGRHRLEEFLKADPDNSTLRIARARYLTADGETGQARALLTSLHAELPDNLVCTAALLECCFEQNDWEHLLSVASAIPAYSPGEPWVLTRMRGEVSLHERHWDGAARYFEQGLISDPANPWSRMGLARAYGELNRPQDREEMQRRSLGLSRIRVSLANIQEDRPAAVRTLSRTCEEIGLTEAAATFRRHAERIEGARP